MNVHRLASFAFGVLGALSATSCAGPLYGYGAPGAAQGYPQGTQGGYPGQPQAPGQAQGQHQNQLQGAYSPAESAGMSGWAPQVQAGADLGNGGGAWAATPVGSPAAADRGASIVSPGSTGIGAPFTPPVGATTPLYGDGGLVQANAPGSLTTLDAPARELEPGGTGRPLMLQQYQAALEERDALRIEVQALTGQLELMQDRIVELQHELQGGDFARAELEHERASFQKQLDALSDENEDLSGRLVTAQIRRLEAEKDLIQLLIDSQRDQPPVATRP